MSVYFFQVSLNGTFHSLRPTYDLLQCYSSISSIPWSINSTLYMQIRTYTHTYTHIHTFMQVCPRVLFNDNLQVQQNSIYLLSGCVL